MVSVLAGICFSQVVEACTCVPSRLACEAAWKADAVFVGTVTQFESTRVKTDRNDVDEWYEWRTATFQLSEAFRGISDKEARIGTGSGGGDCGYSFEIGTAYIVYANRDEKGDLSTGICMRTAPVAEAEEDLLYLRSVGGLAAVGGIQGVVLRFDQEMGWVGLSGDNSDRPVARVTVRAVGPKTEEAQTDAAGNFAFSTLPVGKYRIRPQLPESLVLTYPEETEYDVQPGSCYQLRFVTAVNGKISGRVTDAAGLPVANARVTVFSTKTRGEKDVTELKLSATTDENGEYTVKQIPRGSFVVGINADQAPAVERPFLKTFHPNSPTRSGARVIELGEGEKVTGVDIQAGTPLVEQEIRVRVIGPGGMKLDGGYVYLHDPNYPEDEVVGGELTELAADGRATLRGLQTRTYWLHAAVRTSAGEICAAPTRIVASSQSAELTVSATIAAGLCQCWSGAKGPECRRE